MFVALAAAHLAALIAAAAPAQSPPPVSLGRGPVVARVAVSYSGSGRVDTRYRSTPPNPGAKPDHNYAHDTSRESWRFTFASTLEIGGCSGRGCTAPVTLSGARGSERISGTISHTHVDGIYTLDNAVAHCHLQYATTRAATLGPSPQLTLTPGTGAFTVVANDPLEQALIGLPPTCQGRGDSIDGLLDNYFAPGFSFSARYGADRLLTSAPVRIPVASLSAGRTVRVKLHETAKGTPPRGCAVVHRRYEHCTTTQAWSGVLSFRPAG
jgi:hypothetical protein